MQDFDQKINDENLTKCMQTLKHMYYDLSVKDIYCENEAEFRAYDILLHLNGGDILRSLRRLGFVVEHHFKSKRFLLVTIGRCSNCELKSVNVLKCEALCSLSTR